MKKGAEIELLIEDFGPHGEGMSIIDGHPYFVPFALPREKVKGLVEVAKKEYTSLRLTTIQEESPHRKTPECPRFFSCGGCQLLHISYEAELKIKTQIVRKALSKFTDDPCAIIHDCLPSPKPFHYRNKIQLPVAAKKNGEVVMGFYRPSTHDIIPYDECFVHVESMEEYANALRPLIETSGIRPYNEITGTGTLRHLIIRANQKGEALIGLVVTNGEDPHLEKLAANMIDALPKIKGIVLSINESKHNKIIGDAHQVLWGDDNLVEEVGGLLFSVSLASFFQINREASEVLYDVALRFANLSQQTRLLDAYCGIGTISLLAAKRCKNVVGIECVPKAIENAKSNAANNQIHNVEFVIGKIEEIDNLFTNIDVAILNPPRKGLMPIVAKNLNELGPNQLVYVSCNPTSLARDIGLLTNYALIEAQPLDMFPQTMHVETVAKLIRQKSR